MGKMKEAFMEIREKQCQDETDDYFELITEEEFEDYMRKKYGNNLTFRMMLQNGERPTITDLDNLFNI